MTGRILLTAALMMIAVISTGCQTTGGAQPPLTLADMPPGIPVALFGCRTEAGIDAATSGLERARFDGHPDCVALPRPQPANIAVCDRIDGLYVDFELDPFIVCHLGATGMFVWFAPQPASAPAPPTGPRISIHGRYVMDYEGGI